MSHGVERGGGETAGRAGQGLAGEACSGFPLVSNNSGTCQACGTHD